MRFLRTITFLVVVAVIAGVGIAIWRGSVPLPDPEGCSAKVGGRTVHLDTGQGEVATLIAAIAMERGLPARAVSIALAAGIQESKLRNIRGGDRDSLGIFQQRPSQGWGTRAQILQPTYAINAFYDALVKVDGYESMRITDAAQQVQRSGYPEAYEPHAADARAIASALTGYSSGGRFSCVVHDTDETGTAAKVIASLRTGYGSRVITHGAGRQDVIVDVPGGAAGKRLGWSMAQYLVGHANALRIRAISFDGRSWHIGRASEKGWTKSSGVSATAITVSLG